MLPSPIQPSPMQRGPMQPGPTPPGAEHMATAADLAPFDKGHEVVDGRLVRKASPSFEHGDAQATLAGLLRSFRGRSGEPGGWWFGTEVEVELAEHQIYLPDVAGWRIARMPERPRGRPVRIAPDWVAEILSPSTADRDIGAKLRGYYHARVPHYWLIDPERQELRVLRWREDDYHIVLAAGPGESVGAEPFESMQMDIRELFGE